MKNLRTVVCCVCITLVGLAASAQHQTVPVNEPDQNKPLLFGGLPDVIPVDINSLTSLLKDPVGTTVSLSLSPNARFVFEGQVVSTAGKNETDIQSVVIRSNNFNGAMMSFSRTENTDKSTLYVGRIVSLKHGDLFELQNRNGEYFLVKKRFYDLVNE